MDADGKLQHSLLLNTLKPRSDEKEAAEQDDPGSPKVGAEGESDEGESDEGESDDPGSPKVGAEGESDDPAVGAEGESNDPAAAAEGDSDDPAVEEVPQAQGQVVGPQVHLPLVPYR